ncbi:DUF1304 domain-containing protein [Weissella hellenica]|uniref:DUF1304 domain-containing protein n=1 Tax=Weissella hellenica TaxID=46256 RepID=A0A4Y4FZ97_WEIHE|nr:DUF1304 domain-containing protein [Weissella hellenica]NKY66553.1 DUF1304 domain-containing protein [Weissella hellenica]GED35269.1 membrane protein [Weissella hellenica]SCB82360.1 putative membrane protein [Weissella hellenica]
MIEIILVTIVSVEAIGIMLLEMFGTTRQQANAFELEESFVKMPEVKTLLANQGLYNGLFGVLIIGTLLLLNGSPQTLMLELEMLFVFLAAVYGSLTAAKKIIVIQGLPAFIALIFLIF